jgi:hypothetical protein
MVAAFGGVPGLIDVCFLQVGVLVLPPLANAGFVQVKSAPL